MKHIYVHNIYKIKKAESEQAGKSKPGGKGKRASASGKPDVKGAQSKSKPKRPSGKSTTSGKTNWKKSWGDPVNSAAFSENPSDEEKT